MPGNRQSESAWGLPAWFEDQLALPSAPLRRTANQQANGRAKAVLFSQTYASFSWEGQAEGIIQLVSDLVGRRLRRLRPYSTVRRHEEPREFAFNHLTLE